MKKLLFPSVGDVEPGWLRGWLPAEVGKKVCQCKRSSHLLMRSLYRRFGVPVPGKKDLKGEQRWLLAQNREQLVLARQLGGLACAPFIRKTIRKQYVNQLRTGLGSAPYRYILDGQGLEVAGLPVALFDRALVGGNGVDFITAVGVSLLEETLDGESEFVGKRLKFSFPPHIINMRPATIKADEGEVVSAINRLGRALGLSGYEQH